MIFILLFPIDHRVTGEVCSAQHNIPQSGAGASALIAYVLEEDPTFRFTEETISLKFSECCSQCNAEAITIRAITFSVFSESQWMFLCCCW